MYSPFLEVVYDAEKNEGISTYRCGNTEEIIHYEGQRGQYVKFTPETWPEYLEKLYGKSLPIQIPDYGWVKYVDDAIAIGIPESVYSKYPLIDKSDPKINKLMTIIVERRDYEGNLLERYELFNEMDQIWFNIENGTVDIPEGEDVIEFGMKLAEKLEQERKDKLKASNEVL